MGSLRLYTVEVSFYPTFLDYWHLLLLLVLGRGARFRKTR